MCQVSGVRVQKTDDQSSPDGFATARRGQMSCLRSLGYGAAGFAFVVLRVLNKILIHEDEYEKNQIKSHACVLRIFLIFAFRIQTCEFSSASS